jgi:hypothetical protein
MKNPEKEFPEIKSMELDEVFIKVAYMLLNGKNVPVFVGRVVKKDSIDELQKQLKAKYNSPIVELVMIEK